MNWPRHLKKNLARGTKAVTTGPKGKGDILKLAELAAQDEKQEGEERA